MVAVLPPQTSTTTEIDMINPNVQPSWVASQLEFADFVFDLCVFAVGGVGWVGWRSGGKSGGVWVVGWVAVGPVGAS